MSRQDVKRRANLDYRKKQFASAPAYQNVEYKHRLNFYVAPPTADITLEQFEQWAIDRLRGMLLQIWDRRFQMIGRIGDYVVS